MNKHSPLNQTFIGPIGADGIQAPVGTFYTNQKDKPPNLPRGMTVGDYWLLPSDLERHDAHHRDNH